MDEGVQPCGASREAIGESFGAPEPRPAGDRDNWELSPHHQETELENGKGLHCKIIFLCLFYKSLLFRIPLVSLKETNVHTDTYLCQCGFSHSPEYSCGLLSPNSLEGVHSWFSKVATAFYCNSPTSFTHRHMLAWGPPWRSTLTSDGTRAIMTDEGLHPEC